MFTNLLIEELEEYQEELVFLIEKLAASFLVRFFFFFVFRVLFPLSFVFILKKMIFFIFFFYFFFFFFLCLLILGTVKQGVGARLGGPGVPVGAGRVLLPAGCACILFFFFIFVSSSFHFFLFLL